MIYGPLIPDEKDNFKRYKRAILILKRDGLND